jgi:hypothetical protein
MLHHASFNVRDPAAVAQVLADMLAATAIRAPSPPFPPNAWFVLYGDEAGSFVEILPWGAVLTPDARFGVGEDLGMRPYAGSHVLLSTPHDEEKVRTLAEDAGWLVQMGDAGRASDAGDATGLCRDLRSPGSGFPQRQAAGA